MGRGMEILSKEDCYRDKHRKRWFTYLNIVKRRSCNSNLIVISKRLNEDEYFIHSFANSTHIFNEVYQTLPFFSLDIISTLFMYLTFLVPPNIPIFIKFISQQHHPNIQRILCNISIYSSKMLYLSHVAYIISTYIAAIMQ